MHCAAQVQCLFEHFVSREAMNIENLGPALIASLIATGKIKRIPDLYRLTIEDLESQERMAKKSAKNVYDAIAASKERSLENLESLQETTQNAVDVGAAEQTDADKLMVQVLSLRTSISSTNRSLEMLENSMRLQLGCGVNTKLTLTQTVDDILKPEAILALQNETFNVENNYNYQLLQENSKLLKKQIDLKIMGYVPTLSAYYQYSGRTYFGKKEGFNMTPPNLIGLTLNVPIWSSGKTWSDVKQAKIEYEKFQNTIETTRDALLVQERQLRYNVTSNYETYEAQKLNLEVTERVFTNVSNKFEHGMASSLELTTASSDIISAQSNYISAVLNLVNAQIEFEQLLNRK